MYRISLKNEGQFVYIPDLNTFIYYGKDTIIDEETFDNSRNAREVRHLLNIESDGMDMTPEKNVIETEADLYSIVPIENMTVIVKNFNNTGAPITAIFYENSWRIFGGSGGSGGNYIHPSTHPATMIVEDTNHKFVTDVEKTVWNNKSNFSGNYDDLINKPTIPSDTLDLVKSDVYTKNEVYTKDEVNALVSDIDAYDDTTIKNSLYFMENQLVNKASKTELDKYRQKSEFISESDLSDDVKNKLNNPVYDDTEIRTSITDLENKKIEKTELNNYRLKSELIGESELSENVRNKLNSIDSDSGEIVNYDDTEIKNNISVLNTHVTSLESNKANKTELNNYRLKSELIDESGLSVDVKNKLNSAYDDAGVKSDITDLRTAVVGLETTVNNLGTSATDLNALVKGLNTTVTGLNTTVTGLDTNKADKTELDKFKLKTDKIAETDLTTELQNKLNTSTYDDTIIKSNVDNLTTTVTGLSTSVASLESGKASKTELTSYRLKSVRITETDLTAEVQNKLNVAAYDDTVIKADISSLSTNKVNKSELSSYRKKADLISESDLSTDVKNKLNTPAYDDTKIVSDIASLNTSVTNLGSSKAAKTELNNYRKKSDSIVESDLSVDVKNKLNASKYDDTTIKADVTELTTLVEDLENNKADKTSVVTSHNKLSGLNNDTNYLHINSLEKSKYDGYDVVIKQLQDKIEELSDRVIKLEGGNPDILWTFDFPLQGGTANYDLKMGVNGWSGSLTNEDIYGPELDGMDAPVKLYLLGPVRSVTDPAPTDVTPVEIPRDGLDEFNPPTDHGAWSFNSMTQTISFGAGVLSAYYFRLVKVAK